MSTATRLTPSPLHTGLTRSDAESTPHPRTGSVSSGVLQAKALIVLSTVLRSASTLVLTPLMIHRLGATEYGLWIVVTTITMYASLSESGLGQTVVNKIGEAYTEGRHERVSQIMATAHVLYWLIVGPLALLSVAAIYGLPVAELALGESDADYRALFRLALSVSVTLALIRIPYLVYPGLLIGVRRLPTRVAWEIAATVVALVATAIALLAGASLVTVLVVSNVSLLLMTSAIGLSSRQSGAWARLDFGHFCPELLPRLATNSWFFFLINATGVIDRNIAVMLIPRLDSLAAAPPYFLLVSVLRVAFYSLIAAAPRALQPYVIQWSTRRENERLLETLGLTTRVLTIGATIAVMLFTPFAEAFVNTWLGSACYPGDGVMLLTAGAFLMDAYHCAAILFLIAMNRQRMLSAVLLSKSLLTIALSYAFGLSFEQPLLGLATGAFVASLLPAFWVPSLIRGALGRRPDGVAFAPLGFALTAPLAASVATASLPFSWRLAAIPLLVVAASVIAWSLVLTANDRAAIHSQWRRLIASRVAPPRSTNR